eukprot:CAMPEP_0169293550 /NCGR_PEP_ID=MMETSP1016-20121227/63353_1 /TAXON_ID=342587 /ORGANISM="Karlodinium micrum, Strain CCMP2283" /LENGTH=38 /DNA_ID= /DNA_START= /DNA_END= /DNA_ORIENTATION=
MKLLLSDASNSAEFQLMLWKRLGRNLELLWRACSAGRH